MFTAVLALWLSSATYEAQPPTYSPTVASAYDVSCGDDTDCAEKFGGEY